MLPCTAPAARNHLVMQWELMTSCLPPFSSTCSHKGAGCCMCSGLQFPVQPLMQSCRVCISVTITHTMYFDDEFATRLEKGNKLFMTRQIPVYNPCGYCCIAARF